jgi:hypothetical protein
MYEDQVVSTDTRLGLAKESIISELPIAVTITPEADAPFVASAANPPIESRPTWILPVIGVASAGVLILLIYVFRREAAAQKTPKDGKTREDNPVDSPSKK